MLLSVFVQWGSNLLYSILTSNYLLLDVAPKSGDISIFILNTITLLHNEAATLQILIPLNLQLSPCLKTFDPWPTLIIPPTKQRYFHCLLLSNALPQLSSFKGKPFKHMYSFLKTMLHPSSRTFIYDGPAVLATATQTSLLSSASPHRTASLWRRVAMATPCTLLTRRPLAFTSLLPAPMTLRISPLMFYLQRTKVDHGCPATARGSAYTVRSLLTHWGSLDWPSNSEPKTSLRISCPRDIKTVLGIVLIGLNSKWSRRPTQEYGFRVY